MKSNKPRSSKLIFGIALVAVGAGLLVWALTGKNAGAPAHDHSAHDHGAHDHSSHDQGHEEATDSSAEANGETAGIVYTDSGFEPKTLTVSKGTVVTVKNDSSKRVQFSSGDHPTHHNNPEMNLRELKPGESAAFTALTVGEHSFHDHIDATMTGVLTVTE